MSSKPYLSPRYGKGTKSTSGLIRHFNTCKGHNYPMTQLEISQKHQVEEGATGKNWKDEGDLLGKTNNTAMANSIANMPTKDKSWKRLLASEFLLALREEWFSSYEFFAGTQVLDIKYKHPGS